MTTDISLREWEALSAYLDGQLTQKERQRLEGRLQKSQELRQALEDLRRTRAILRSQPKLRAPRNFTLTPEMVGQRAPARSMPRAYPTFRLVSALASVLFVLVLIGDFFGRAPVAPTGNPAPAAVMMESSVEKPAAAAAAVPAPEEAAPQAELSQLQTKESERSMANPAEEEAQTEALPEEGDLSVASEPSAAGEIQPFASDNLPGDAALVDDTSPAMGSPALPPGVLRSLEIGLAALAVLAGLVAFSIRRSTQ